MSDGLYLLSMLGYISAVSVILRTPRDIRDPVDNGK